MTEFRVNVDITDLQRALAAAPNEVRRAARNSINDTLVDVQKAEQNHILRAFDVRARSFILNSVKITKEDRATVDKLEGSVGIDPQRNLLAKFERGGAKVSIRGKKYIAVPTREIATTGGHVKPSYAFKRFQPFVEVSSLFATQKLGSQRTTGRKTQLIGQRNSFFIDLASGPALAQRTAASRGRFRVLYLFLRSVDLPPLLQFENIGEEIIKRAWPVRTQQAIVFALKRAGLRVA